MDGWSAARSREARSNQIGRKGYRIVIIGEQ